MKGADKKISIIFLKAHIHSLVCMSSTAATPLSFGWRLFVFKMKELVKLIKRVKIARYFLQYVSDQFHVIILSLPM